MPDIFRRLPTEKPLAASAGLDRLPPKKLLALFDRQDARVVKAVSRVGGPLRRAVGLAAGALRGGGRLCFIGAGTSGRLGVLEAAECPPTFGTRPSQVQALMAGGRGSVFRSREGAEDQTRTALHWVRTRLSSRDVLVGVAASGVTPFVRAGLEAARRRGVPTVLVTCNPGVSHSLADVVIAPRVGPEILTGSTRLKAGAATKMILNRLTTLAMISLGKVYGHWMVDLKPRSRKLVARARRLVQTLGRVDARRAGRLLAAAGGESKTAILMGRKNLTAPEARRRLARAGGFLRKALAACVIFGGMSRLDAAVKTGLDVLEESGFAPLVGKRVGLITNHTGVDGRGVSTVDVLRRAPGVTLAAVFSPEHGLRGRIEGGEKISDATYPGTDIPVYSLYGAVKRPTSEHLRGLDVLVFDIQDVGARFYTYITTLGYAMEEASARGIHFVVLDRPNPLGGEIVEGAVLDGDIRHFTAYYSIPQRHGMTVGEIALWHRAKAGLTCDLEVISMEGWKPDMLWPATGLVFPSPSPNIRNFTQALLYAGLGSFEATNVSVGRGTPAPFEWVGAPWVDGRDMARFMNAAGLPGVSFAARRLRPRSDLYAGKRCGGVAVRVTDPAAARPVAVFVWMACFLRDRSPADFKIRWEEMPRLVGTRDFQRLFAQGASPTEILSVLDASVAAFKEDRRKYLIYPE
jgi:N-acetylmuramic acid 6-phosphate etherase